MRKMILILLVLSAVGIYIWDVYLIVEGFSRSSDRGGSADTGYERQSFKLSLMPVPSIDFKEKGRSPFTAKKTVKKPVKKSVKRVKKRIRKKEKVNPPAITITGIMWSPSNPVAMVKLPDGSSDMAKQGKTLAGNIRVGKIEKNRIRVEYKGELFWIGK